MRPRLLGHCRPSATVLVACTWVCRAVAASWYIAPWGNDTNPGTSNAPFATPQKAFAVMAAGDTLWARGGTYALTAEARSAKGGTATNPCKLWAWPGEQPVFDFAGAPTGKRGLYLNHDFWHIRGIEVARARDNGIFVGSSSNLIEGCVVHDCEDDGIYVGNNGRYNLILNCDSYRNFQPSSGGNNGDGFAAKSSAGPGNVFRNCRAWHNSDDGFDYYYNVTNAVVMEGCWAFWNGYDLWGVGTNFSGNGNGFKLGGAGTWAEHALTNCVAFGNRAKGFDQNHNMGGLTLVHCTGYSNAVNFSLYETPTNGTLLRHRLINCVAFTGTATRLDPTALQLSNSWQNGPLTAADFASLDAARAAAPRRADFSLPWDTFLRPTELGRLVDRGLDIGRPFWGAAPDLGAWEFVPDTVRPQLELVGGWSPGQAPKLRARGLTGRGPVVWHASANLTNWLPVATNPATLGAAEYLDAAGAALPRRFYRVIEQR